MILLVLGIPVYNLSNPASKVKMNPTMKTLPYWLSYIYLQLHDSRHLFHADDFVLGTNSVVSNL